MKYLAIRLITLDGKRHFYNLKKCAFSPNIPDNKKDYEAKHEDLQRVLFQHEGQGHKPGSITLVYVD